MPKLYSIKSGKSTVSSGPTITGISTKKLEGARSGAGRSVPQVIPSISRSGRGFCGTRTMPKVNRK